MNSMSDRLKSVEEIVKEVTNRKAIQFSGLVPSALPENVGAVYLIFDDHDGRVLYVGRTNNIRRRVYTNHLMGNRSNARLKKYLVEDVGVPEVTDYVLAKQFLRDRCSFKYLEIQDPLARGKIEGLCSYCFDTKYIEEEH